MLGIGQPFHMPVEVAHIVAVAVRRRLPTALWGGGGTNGTLALQGRTGAMADLAIHLQTLKDETQWNFPSYQGDV